MSKKLDVRTTTNGRPYIVTKCGCPRFISIKEATAAGWSKPLLPLPKKPTKRKKK